MVINTKAQAVNMAHLWSKSLCKVDWSAALKNRVLLEIRK